MSRTRVATLAVGLVIFVVLAEAAALAVYYIQTGGFFYLHRKTYKPIPETRDRALTADVLHPYFGPSHRPGTPFSVPEIVKAPARSVATNNFGFVSPYDYPYVRRSDNELIVGIFGGSVGVWFCELGAERLRENLKRSPFFSGKDLVTLCFSHEGYKQPQQALILAYFLSIGQELDLAINIDGFNEVALGNLNDGHGLDVSMPSVMHIDPLINLVNQATLTPDKLESLAAIARYKRRLNDLAEWINSNRVASINFGLEQYYRIVSNRLLKEQFTFAALPSNPSETSLVFVTPKIRDRSGAALFDDIARNWVAASRLMHEMLASRSVPYYHVLQPNQYHTQRRFAADEARVAISAQSPFREGVEKGYPVLVKAAAAFTGVRFLDATGVFDREPGAVYMDDCCHYTLDGNRILADYIAERILSSDWVRR